MRPAFPYRPFRLFALVSSFGALVLTGCGGGSNPATPSPTPTPAAKTNVVLMLTSTGNDKLQSFNVQLTGLTLTSKSGSTVTLFSSNPYTSAVPEFSHLNGSTEPFLTVSVPQDTYVSATATVGSAQFTCVEVDPQSGDLDNSTFAYGSTPEAQVTTSLPQPITVTSSPLGIALDLQTATSASYSACSGGVTYSINPTFFVEALPFGSPNTTSVNGEETTVEGTVASIDANSGSFTVNSADGPIWNVATSADTVFQGISGATALATGQPVDMDIVFDTQGDISARRVEILDTVTANLTYGTGVVTQIAPSQNTLIFQSNQSLGFFDQPTQHIGIDGALSYANAVFKISGSPSNLASLPFTPVFNASTLTDGQKLAVTTQATTQQGSPTAVPLTTITLMPQTLNGTITNITSTGSGPSALTVYTIALAPYDLFPDLNVQAGQPTRIAHPSEAAVFVQGGSIGIQNPSVGTPYRFNGLIFNDGGTLKMDCLDILDGVPE